MSDEKPICDAVCVICKKVKAPTKESAGLPPGTKQVLRGCPEAGPQGPDADHDTSRREN